MGVREGGHRLKCVVFMYCGGKYNRIEEGKAIVFNSLN
jgi:hypothetical protein